MLVRPVLLVTEYGNTALVNELILEFAFKIDLCGSSYYAIEQFELTVNQSHLLRTHRFVRFSAKFLLSYSNHDLSPFFNELNGSHGEYTGTDDLKNCWNCGGNHVIKDCKKPRDQEKIAKNRKLLVNKDKNVKEEENFNVIVPDIPVEVEEPIPTPTYDLDELRSDIDLNGWKFHYPTKYQENFSLWLLLEFILYYFFFTVLIFQKLIRNENYTLRLLCLQDLFVLIYRRFFASSTCVLFMSQSKEISYTLTRCLETFEFYELILSILILVGIVIFIGKYRLHIFANISAGSRMLLNIRLYFKRRTYSRVEFVEWIEDSTRWIIDVDGRHDAHGQGKILHKDPLCALVRVFFYEKNHYGLMVLNNQTIIISYEAFIQFTSSERTSFLHDFKMNVERIKRAMRNLTTVNYDRFSVLDMNLESPMLTGDDILSNSAYVAMLWVLGKSQDHRRVFGAVLENLN